MAFFDFRSKNELEDVEEILRHRIAFRVPVAPDAAASGGWRLLGIAQLRGQLAERACYRHRPVGSQEAYLYKAGVSSPASPEELEGLEDLSTWFSTHVEERLEDHFAGRPNRHVEMMAKRR